MPIGLGALARAWRRSIAWLRRDAIARQLDEELRMHHDMLVRDLTLAGASPANAHAAARKQIGNPLALRERAEDAWRFVAIDEVLQDLRFGVRLLLRSPMFAVISIAAIGLAIGINAGFFTLIDAFVWRPIPVARADRLVKLALTFSPGGGTILFSYPQVRAITDHATTLDDVLAVARCAPVAFRPSSSSTAIPVAPACVAGSYFASLGGAAAAAGRPLIPDDDRVDAAPAIVISDYFWTRVFARAPDIVGRDVIVNGTHATVAGVMRREFVGVIPLVPDFWMTISLATRIGATPGRLDDPDNRFIDVRAHLRAGVTMAQARAELSGLVAEPVAAMGSVGGRRVSGAGVQPSDSMLPLTWQISLLLAPAVLVVALVLVIACANLANLMLSRALARQREIAVRLAIGASRARLIRQLLTEGLLIGLAGAVLGLLFARYTVTIVSRAYFANIPSSFGTIAISLDPSWRVVAYTVALAVMSVLIFGLTPALHATSSSLTASLKGEDTALGTRIRRSRFRNALLAAQVAGSLVLLVASGTLVASMRSFGLASSDLETNRVAVAKLGLSAVGRVPASLESARATFAARVSALSTTGITARALHAPYASWFPLMTASPAGGEPAYRHMQFNAVTPRYFDVVGQRIIAGRAFTAADSVSGARVAIVTATAASQFWPGAAAVGQDLRVEQERGAPDVPYRIVGVVADAHSGMVWDDDRNGYVYLPATASDFSSNEMPLLVRSDTPFPVLSRALGDIARDVDPNAPFQVEPVLVQRETMLVPIRYGTWITAGVGAFGLALALIGLYGVVSFAVVQRQQDLAIHIAIGASSRDVLRLVLAREMRLVVIGLGIGLALSATESRLIEAWVSTLTPLGVGGLALLTILLFIVAAVAGLIPALGAVRLSPMTVLRRE